MKSVKSVKNLLYWVAMTTLAVLVLVQLATGRDGTSTSHAVNYVGLMAGSRIEASVRETSDPTGHLALSDLAQGLCTYVAVYAPRCGGSQVGLMQWRQVLASYDETYHTPGEWQVLWVSVDPLSHNEPSIFDGLPFRVFEVVTQGTLEAEAQIEAYPAHLVLDRDGRLVQAGVGLPFPEPDRLSSDCTLDSLTQP